jgi:serine/threonine protein kinase/tetratricopeptide (TPR) repeat protein
MTSEGLDSGFGFDLPDERWLQRVRAGLEGESSTSAEFRSESRDRHADAAGQRVGPYELVALIGSGGMGTVWRARQDDRQFEHHVALKLIKRGMDTDEILHRFRFERHVLATLQHPHIARLHGGGATFDGRPYLAMECIDGVPIDAWSDRQGRGGEDVPRQLRVFLKVCEAVQHAHQRGVIHRDLKPTNVLVDARDEPRVLDFGLAKLVSPAGTGFTQLTMTASFLGTPAYTSPEQAAGTQEPVDVRADVYSLGVLLFRMLTGKLPHDPDLPLLELLHAIREEDAPKPSSLNDAVGTELDAIIAKALQKEQDQRYASVEALAADVQRHLSGEAVLAHPPRVWYRLRKYAKRHRAVLSGVTIAVAALLGGSALAIDFGLRAKQAQLSETEALGQAVEEGNNAKAATEFLQRILITDNPGADLKPDTTLEELLDYGSEMIAAGELADRPAVEAAARVTLGRAYTQNRMAWLGENHLRKASATFAELYGETSLEYVYALSYLSTNLWECWRYEESCAMRRRVIALMEEHYPLNDARLVHEKWALSSLLRDMGEYEEAEQIAWDALAHVQGVYGPESVKAAEARYRVAHVLTRKGDPIAGERELRHSLDTYRQATGEEGHHRISYVMLRLAQALQEQERYEEAAAQLHEALELEKQRYGQTHPLTTRMYRALARNAEAARWYDEADQWRSQDVEARRQYYGDRPGGLWDPLSDWARSKWNRRDVETARNLAREALDDFVRMNNRTRQRPERLYRFARRLRQAHAFAEAEALMKGQVDRLAHRPGTEPAELAEAMEHLLKVYRDWEWDAYQDARVAAAVTCDMLGIAADPDPITALTRYRDELAPELSDEFSAHLPSSNNSAD